MTLVIDGVNLSVFYFGQILNMKVEFSVYLIGLGASKLL
jgi:hypothetical protein